MQSRVQCDTYLNYARSVAFRFASSSECRNTCRTTFELWSRVAFSSWIGWISSDEKIMKYLIDYVRGYLTKNEGNIEPVWNMADSDFESDFEESLIFNSHPTRWRFFANFHAFSLARRVWLLKLHRSKRCSYSIAPPGFLSNTVTSEKVDSRIYWF